MSTTKRILLIFGFIVFLGSRLIAQNAEGDEVEIPPFAMKQAVGRITTWYFKPARSPRKVYLSDKGIKKEWLPNIKNIEFVLMENKTEGYSRSVYFFSRPQGRNGRYRITFSYGDPNCHARGDIWSLRVSGGQLRLGRTQNLLFSHCTVD